jgi:asparagine synthase (glutamine-hydrolysing)
MMSPYILSILGDRQEMAHAIEGRTPLLDHHLFEAARHIPDNLKINGDTEKFVFREAMKDRVIPEIYANKKWPYSAPPFWLLESTSPTVKKLLRRYLNRSAIEEAGVFNYRTLFIVRFLHKWLPGDLSIRRRMNTMLVFVLSVQMVYDLYIKNFEQNIEAYGRIEF